MTPNTPAHFETNASSSRVEWVDKAKGICIILVVMMHTTLGLEKAMGETGWMHYLVEFARPFRMPDFFMISGLFLAATIDRPWKLYLDRKVIHFFYFYILWVGIQFLLKAPLMISDGQTPIVIMKSFFFAAIQPFGTLWFIYMLPVFFVITKLFKSRPWELFGLAVLLQVLPINTSSFLAWMTHSLGVVSVDSYWLLIDEFCSFFVYFLAGYLFAPQIFKLADKVCDHVYVALIGIGVWLTINGTMVALGWAGLPLLSLALGAAGAVGIVAFATILSTVGGTRGLSHLGANSIVVYLAFFVPMIISRLVLVKFFPWLDVGSMAAVSILISVITPLLGYEIIKKIGFGMFLFHRPAWAIFAKPPLQNKAVLHPAE